MSWKPTGSNMQKSHKHDCKHLLTRFMGMRKVLVDFQILPTPLVNGILMIQIKMGRVKCFFVVFKYNVFLFCFSFFYSFFMPFLTALMRLLEIKLFRDSLE